MRCAREARHRWRPTPPLGTALLVIALGGCAGEDRPAAEGPLRVVDRTRTPLTAARIDSLLDLAAEMREAHPPLASFLDSREVTQGYEARAAEVVGQAAATEIERRGMAPDPTVADLFWIRLIRGAQQDGGVEARIVEIQEELAELVLLGGDNPDALAEAELRLEMHQRIGAEEERVIATRGSRIDAIFHRPPAAGP